MKLIRIFCGCIVAGAGIALIVLALTTAQDGYIAFLVGVVGLVTAGGGVCLIIKPEIAKEILMLWPWI